MDRAADTLTDAADAQVATWADVESYFPGSACDKCCYLMRLRDEFGGHIRCYLLRPFDGRGRPPEPSDCRGVVRQMEDADVEEV